MPLADFIIFLTQILDKKQERGVYTLFAITFSSAALIP